MSTETSKKLFVDLFLELARSEKKLEVIRQIICEIEEFEPYSIFLRIRNEENRNFITGYDISLLLGENFQNTEEELIKKTFIYHYDFDNDGALCYAEFLRVVLPGDHPNLRTQVSQKPIIKKEKGEKFSEELEYTLAKLFNEIISNYIRMDFLKLELYEQLKGSYATLFNQIDENESGFLDFNNLLSFFKKVGVYPYEEEIVSGLRFMDKNDDGRINLEELKKGLTPRLSDTKFTKTQYNKPKEKTILDSNQKCCRMKTPEKVLSSKKQNKLTSKSKEKTFDSKEKHKIYESPLKIVKSKSFHKTEQKSVKKSHVDSPFKKASHYDTFKKEKKIDNYELPNFGSKIKNLKTENFEKSSEVYKIKEISNFLKKIVFLEREIERWKQDLALRPDFNLLDFFALFDGEEKGYLTNFEIKDMVNNIGCLITKEQIILLLQRYDRKKLGKIKYIVLIQIKFLIRFSNFVDIFSPFQEDYSNLLNQRKPLNLENNISTFDELFSTATKKLIKELLKNIVENEMEIEGARRLLNKNLFQNDQDLREIFNLIDLDHSEHLTPKKIKKFLEQREIYITDRDANCLFDRFDANKKGRVTFAEFREELSEKLRNDFF